MGVLGISHERNTRPICCLYAPHDSGGFTIAKFITLKKETPSEKSFASAMITFIILPSLFCGSLNVVSISSFRAAHSAALSP